MAEMQRKSPTAMSVRGRGDGRSGYVAGMWGETGEMNEDIAKQWRDERARKHDSHEMQWKYYDVNQLKNDG